MSNMDRLMMDYFSSLFQAYRKMRKFRVVQFSRYFAVGSEPRKLKSAEIFSKFDQFFIVQNMVVC